MDASSDRFRNLSPERFAQIRRIFETASELSFDARPSYLDSACGDDPGLRMEVELLLQASEQSFAMLDKPAIEQSATSLSGPTVESGIVGTTFSHYRLLSRLGRGGMGIVYRALDTRLEREVALKFLPDRLLQDLVSLERFRREARAASRINHPHICTVHDVGEHNGKPFLVMELLHGETIKDRLRHGRISFTELVEWCSQIADALDAAHNAGIIHRDVKSANIFITDRGQAKVLDFGLARSVQVRRKAAAVASDESATFVDFETSPGQTLGTVSYMSPEQARGEELDRRTDIFSLGIVMYEMATGELPFGGASSALIFDAILNREPPSLLKRNSALAPELDRIVGKALEKDRKFRYQSAADLLADLERLKRDTSSRVAAVPQALPTSIGLVNKRPWFVSAVLIFIAAVAWFSWRWFAHSTPVEPQQQITTPVAITTYPGAEEDASLSPDGNQVAFSGNVQAENNFDIYIKEIGSESLLRLTQDPAADTRPLWSPDGRWIAFERAGKLFLIPPLGGTERLLSESIGRPQAWSQDSKWIVATTTGSAGTGSLIRISAETGERSQLLTENDVTFASLSPDNHMVLYDHFDGGQVWFMVAPFTVTGPLGLASRLGKVNAYVALGCAWTRNNRDVICACRKKAGQQSNLWRIDTQNERPPEPLPFTEGASAPSISIAGNGLAYDHFEVDSDIWRISLQKRAKVAPQPVRFLSSTRFEELPEYSPGGSQIAFLSSRSGTSEIWIANADGQNSRMLTSRDVSSCPKWSPDGRSITFVSNDDLYTVPAGGGIPIRLQHSPVERIESPSFSPNGNWIYFIGSYKNREKEIWRVRANGGAAESLGGKGAITAIASPEGDYVYYTKRDPTKCTLRRMHTDGTQDELTIDSDPTVEYAACPQFTFAQGGIFYIPVEHLEQISQLMFLDLKRSVSRIAISLGKASRRISRGLTVSPDGQWALYAGFDYQGDLMLIDPFR